MVYVNQSFRGFSSLQKYILRVQFTNFQTFQFPSRDVRTLEEGAVVERDKLEAEKKELEGRANFLLFTQEQLRSQVS